MSAKWLAGVVSIVVLAAVVVAFVTVGGPYRQRQLRFDQQRVTDLQNIQSQIVRFWQQKNQLPANLTDLTDSISGFKAPMDPETKVSYEYIVQTDLNFQLCANFKLPSNSNTSLQPAIYPYYNWDHSAGHVCFDRNIDPQLYRIPPVVPFMK